MKQKSRKKSDRWPAIAVCIFLAGVTWLVFGQTLRHEFINFDDDAYVFENPTVARGFTVQGILWAFSHVHASNWHPLTWISHMLDCQLYGLNPGGHHLTSVLLHAATAISLFLVLRQMTGSLWRSALVAALFAIHPLRVESVAWVAERKDVLSGLFFVLTIGAYVRYVRLPRSASRYALVMLLFALGLMSKPMLVTLPCILFLLDYWPLNRVANGGENNLRSWRYLFLEKLPLFGLAAASCAATLFAQTIAIRPLTQISLPLRLGNAVIACVVYFRQMLWPSDLAIFYPFSALDVTVLATVLSVVLLAGISTAVFVLRRRHPYLVIGWMWYLIMLGPVIGILQVGSQAHADRYTYLPQIGLYLLLTWAAVELCGRLRYRRLFLSTASTVIIAALIFSARLQASSWQNSETLWTHALASATDNSTAEAQLGHAYYLKQKMELAIAHFEKALQIEPNQAFAQSTLGMVLLEMGRVDESLAHLQKAVEVQPDSLEAHANLGLAFLQMGRFDESVTHLQRALEIDPNHANAHYNLGNTFLQMGRIQEALAHYTKALEINPNDTEVLNNMAWVLATAPDASIRNGQKALKMAQRAVSDIGNRQPRTLATLAAALAENGRFPDANRTAEQALRLAIDQHNFGLADSIRAQLELYRSNLPFRDNRSTR
ncbi:MAG: protein O-mannosyl-transferase [Verrucomicrobiota bacterium]